METGCQYGILPRLAGAFGAAPTLQTGAAMNSSPIRFAAFVIAVAGLFVSGPVWPDAYPSRPLRLVIAGPAAGGADALARPIAKKLSGAFGQQVVVENRGGGAGLLASQSVLAARPDGYTLMFANAINMSVAPAIRNDLPLDPVNDFAPVTMVATTSLVIAVHPSLPARSLGELVALAKSRPGELLFASNGEGTIQHLTIAMFSAVSGIRVVHVPHKGGTPAVLDTVGGHTEAIITAMPTLLAQVRASRLRALAVTSPKRSHALPQTPTVAESGWPGFRVVHWYGVFAHSKTPQFVIARWHEELRKAGEDADVRAAISREGADLAINGPVALAEFQRADIAQWRNVVRDARISPK